ncbi:MAG: glycosyltransferase family 4 protein [Syntrophomonadaceae bacterium]|nr:glycosyltransferase family 4 protein [Syntrophomonadaceae bacterium]MDD4550337.1 glycosyltransferase family 4 protein [Syntrophomonadaceae bacterium]
MTILNVGTYPPKQCGIATFSMDFRNSLTINNNDVKIMAISDEDYDYQYPDEVIFNLNQNQKQDYLRAAAFVNSAPAINLLVIQHEYGIYGGKDGEYITEMVKLLHKPYVLITHTVLPHPSKHQKQVLNNLCHRAAGIACMTQRSADLLTNLYEAPPEIIKIIPHGVPEFKKQPTDLLKRKYNLESKDIISTFGLIGPGKGLELGIQAMADIVPDYPEAIFMILGQTHPMLQKKEGEKYRQMLENLVYELKLEKNVLFVNKFLSDEELGEYLYMTDIFLSPYPNKDQAVSGTLSFAIGCGRAIVSTSYAFASEMLEGGKGLLAEDASPAELASLVRKILADNELKSSLQEKALKLGQSWSWPNIGKQYTTLFNQLLDTNITEESSYHYARL